MQITESPSPQLLNLSPTHMHHRHIDHALTSRTRLWRTPVPNSSHPSVCRCCRRRRRCCSSPWQPNIIPSPYMMSRYHFTFRCLVPSHRVRRKHHRNVTRHTHPGYIHPSLPRVRYALGIGFGKAGRVVLLSLTLHKLDKAWKNRAWHWVWGMYFSGILRVGALEKTGFKQQAKSGQTGLALAPQILGSSIIRSQICRACVGHLAAAADLARYRAAESR